MLTEIEEELGEFLSKKSRVTMEEILNDCFKIPNHRRYSIYVGRVLKKLNWYRYQDSKGKRYYTKIKGGDIATEILANIYGD